MSVQETITQKLNASLSPVYLEVINESHNHSGPKNAETHFKVVVAGPVFDGKKPVDRHRLVNAALQGLMGKPIHALSIFAYTPQEWSERQGQVNPSPPCLGGSKK